MCSGCPAGQAVPEEPRTWLTRTVCFPPPPQDAGPEAVSLRKGDVLLRLAVRHDSQELLDKMRNMPLVGYE